MSTPKISKDGERLLALMYLAQNEEALDMEWDRRESLYKTILEWDSQKIGDVIVELCEKGVLEKND